MRETFYHSRSKYIEGQPMYCHILNLYKDGVHDLVDKTASTLLYSKGLHYLFADNVSIGGWSYDEDNIYVEYSVGDGQFDYADGRDSIEVKGIGNIFDLMCEPFEDINDDYFEKI